MATPQSTIDIARQTFKTLAARKIVPTPENYRTVFYEIAGTPPPESGNDRSLLATLGEIAKRAPAFDKLKIAIEKGDAGAAAKAVEQMETAAATEPLDWGGLVKSLVRQWDLKQSGLTSARKRDALDRVTINFSKNPAELYIKLSALVASWAENPAQAAAREDEAETSERASDVSAAPAPPAGVPVSLHPEEDTRNLLGDLLYQTLASGVAPRLSRHPELTQEVIALSHQAREARSPEALKGLGQQLKQLWIKLELRSADDDEIVTGLLNLLRLLIDNISELLIDDQWLRGQILVMQEIISAPLNKRMLFDAERSFKEVIFKQGTLKHSLREAKATLKSVVTTFMERIAEMSESTGGYHKKIEGYTERIRNTDDLNQLNSILSDLLGDTRNLQLEMLRSHEDLVSSQRKVESAEQKIRDLEAELDQVSELVYQDHLTQTLNRRGLDDAFKREFARADRYRTPVSIALLDIDHFKKFNDQYGHEAGDGALVHLVGVIRDLLRPTDVVARYGGEEFVIILPDSALENAVAVMKRLQRELTKRFFLHKNDRLLITFSAGVAERAGGEVSDAVMERADAVLYEAKAAGRNLVIGAPPVPR